MIATLASFGLILNVRMRRFTNFPASSRFQLEITGSWQLVAGSLKDQPWATLCENY
jgi:hypothetical protein